MKTIRRLFFSVAVILITTACSAPTLVPSPTPEPTPTVEIMLTDAFGINRRLGRGVNLGNALEGPTEGAWGVTLEEGYFQLIADRGFDSVRIPIRWSAHAEITEPYTIDPQFFERVDWAVENALKRDLAVVINFHHYDEIFEKPTKYDKHLLAMWAQVAEHYKNQPPEVVFEILNEPHGGLTYGRWNKLIIKILAVIRETNPDRAVMIGPGEWNGIYALKNLQLPEEDQNLIVTVHYYLPFEFTHQGAEWSDGSDAWMGRTWKGTPGQQAALRADLNIAAEWGQSNNRPIYLGEFGVYSKADMESRALWTEAVARTAEEFGFSWGYWEFCAGFGIYNPQAKTWNEPLAQALIPEN